jgi:hypothetical protein
MLIDLEPLSLSRLHGNDASGRTKLKSQFNHAKNTSNIYRNIDGKKHGHEIETRATAIPLIGNRTQRRSANLHFWIRRMPHDTFQDVGRQANLANIRITNRANHSGFPQAQIDSLPLGAL